MKIERLLLRAFGPFTDRDLDFSGAANLHLVFGPNEAGKSSALRAMLDLRFGIPERSADDFVHAFGQLRVAGVFVDEHGGHWGFMRRKGRGHTLCPIDPETGETIDGATVSPEQTRALTSGLERAEFERMFGIDHARLREGGTMLLKGEGELGTALFEASAGTRGIAAVLTALDADTKKLHNPHARAQHATINEARREFEEQRKLMRQATTRPAEWQRLQRAHDTAREALDEITRRIVDLRRRENELTELRTVEPLLRTLDQAQASAATLAAVRDLAVDARESRLAIEQSLRRAQQDLGEAELEMAGCDAALAALIVEDWLLDHAAAIERLARGVDGAVRDRLELRKVEAEIAQRAEALAEAATRIAPAATLPELLGALPSAAERKAIDAHLRRIHELDVTIASGRDRAGKLRDANRRDAARGSATPDPVLRASLATALREVQAIGDVESKIAEVEREIGELDERLQRALAQLGRDEIGAQGDATLVSELEITRARQATDELAQALRAAQEEERRLAGDLEVQRLRRLELAAGGEVVTADTLRRARERRDEGWRLVRRVYIEGDPGAHVPAKNYDPQRPLAESFEMAQRTADHQADVLRADAERAAGYEVCVARIVDMERRRSELADCVTGIERRQAEQAAEWSRRLRLAGLPVLEPEALRMWQADWRAAAAFAQQATRLGAERDRLVSVVRDKAACLASALAAAGEAVADVSPATLIDTAVRWERAAHEADGRLRQRAEAEAERGAELATIEAELTERLAERAERTACLASWHTRLLLSPSSGLDIIPARIEELDALAHDAAALRAARERAAVALAAATALAHDAHALAPLIGEPVPLDVDDFAARMRRRLALARDAEQARKEFVRQRQRAADNARRAQAELARARTVLDELCAAAGVAEASELPAREEMASRKRETHAALERAREQLARASGCTEENLRGRLAGQDSIALEAERAQCTAELERLERAQVTARAAEETARWARDAIDASDQAAAAREAMESAAARLRAALRPWARQRLGHALLREALRRFRERAQGPMLTTASRYFAVMTGGRYPSLLTDDLEDPPVLRAQRDDDAQLGVDGLSEGTRDQLYLALRLAALDLRRDSGGSPMPLVLDDVLVTSDDARSAAILGALADFSARHQVLVFTHHRHLLELARRAVRADRIALHEL